MRLLNTETLQLHEFYSDIPTYAILSHTWDREEVTFQDMQNPQVAERKAGYAKLLGACTHARKYNFEWIWIDTCCINKESSAELSEAINSMYGYYGDSEVCFVYLSDASSAEEPRDVKSSFRKSRWFKRGWTLQELLAPRYCVFLGKDWEDIGTRWSLRDAISELTGIPSRVFEDGDMTRYSIAQKMSWAAFRETTRPEDQTYSLMGLFGVNMPPLYGEGAVKAFMRLQHEIIKVSDDRSIFVWIARIGEKGTRGLFAKSPFEFRMSGEVAASETDTFDGNSSYTFANNGLHIHLPLVPIPDPEDYSDQSKYDQYHHFLASLHCRSQKDDGCEYLSVYLRRIDGKKGPQFVRCRADELALTSKGYGRYTFQVRDLVVKENNHIPSFAQHQERDAEELVVSVKLSDTVTRNCLVFDGSQDIKGLSTFSVAKCGSLSLKYRVCSPNGTSQTSLVLKLLRAQSNRLSLEVTYENPSGGLPDYVGSSDHELVDTITLPLVNGGLVSFQCRNTGKCMEKNLDIIYLPRGDALTALKRELTPPTAGFIVPSEPRIPNYYGTLPVFQWISSLDFIDVTAAGVNHSTSLQRVASLDLFDVYYGFNLPYVSFQTSTFRILTYTINSAPLLAFDVALGFRGVVPWVHISLSGKKFEVDGQERDLAAYLNIVSRRTDHWPEELQTSSMTMDIPRRYDATITVTVSIEARTTIQLGSHLLRFDMSKSRSSYP
ncbi:hypothetical protein D9758_002410 [Tetrapyrgos nigripes]|uniref:Heterokaryon incompatibility domain-containing protein n=1 Tax=Tetrapyrgos nigripes TaxID=182062 RepID=A0A8H5GNM0_9AGAR|nr:hypothetical protein D9758_002410 [Tetrapyrgos nigripes]